MTMNCGSEIHEDATTTAEVVTASGQTGRKCTCSRRRPRLAAPDTDDRLDREVYRHRRSSHVRCRLGSRDDRCSGRIRDSGPRRRSRGNDGRTRRLNGNAAKRRLHSSDSGLRSAVESRRSVTTLQATAELKSIRVNSTTASFPLRQQRRVLRTSKQKFFLLKPWLLLFLLNELALSSVVSFGSSEFCKQIRGLSPHQRVMCQAQPRSIVVVSEGVQMAMHECRWQFRNNRWNCTNDGNDTVFGTELRVASKETAYDYAIKSAGILYAIVTACGQGRLSECGCDTRNHPFYRARRRTPQRIDRSGGVGMSEKWRWGGCSVDIAYGLNYTRRFMDAREVRRNERSLMNIHNYEAGRMVIKQHLLKACRCHGVSGSCTMRTCWITLPSFRSVGAILRERFSDAKQVEAWQSGARRRPTALKLVDRFTKPRTNDLVFLDKSPRFCERQPRTGSVGTHGRQCNSTSRAPDSCGSLCCGRGYQVEEYDTTEMCRCKFLWCCVVTCEKCVRRVRKYTCN